MSKTRTGIGTSNEPLRVAAADRLDVGLGALAGGLAIVEHALRYILDRCDLVLPGCERRACQSLQRAISNARDSLGIEE
jgi:hypothetical protein